MMLSLFMIIFNLLLICIYFSYKYNTSNDYLKEKSRFIKLRIKYIYRIINISYILIFLIHLLIIAIECNISFINDFTIIFLLYLINILLFILFEITTKKKTYKFKIIDKKIINNKLSLLISSFIVLFIFEKTTYKYIFNEEYLKYHDFINNYNIVLKIICTLIITCSIYYLIKLLYKNKDICSYSYKEDLYLEDIGFYNRVNIKKMYDYLIFIVAYIVFFCIHIPYIFVFYIVLLILLVYLIYRKIKKIKYESDRLYKNVSILKNKPGITYAFNFTKDLLKLNKLCYITILYFVSVLCYYGIGESAFGFISSSMYIILLYTIIENKIYLIRYVSSLNEEFIDDKKYSIKEKKKINYIDTINLFGIKIYKLIINDSIVYESNIILYDPEYIIDEVDNRINKLNINDYIIIDKILYQEE